MCVCVSVCASITTRVCVHTNCIYGVFFSISTGGKVENGHQVCSATYHWGGAGDTIL